MARRAEEIKVAVYQLFFDRGFFRPFSLLFFFANREFCRES